MSRLELLQSTEQRILSVAGEPVDHGDYRVLRSERFAGWYQANMIELVRPGGRVLADWERIFREHFNAGTYPHTTLYIPDVSMFEPLLEEADAMAGAVADPGLRIQHITYMVTPTAERCPPLPDDLVLRRLETDDDWADLLEFSIAEDRDEPGYRDDGPTRRFFKIRRVVSEAIGIEWFGLSEPGRRELVSRLGVFVHEGVGRLQSIGTLRGSRRRGYAGALIGHAARVALGVRGAGAVGLGVESGSEAESTYTGLGFEPVGSECWIMRYPVRD